MPKGNVYDEKHGFTYTAKMPTGETRSKGCEWFNDNLKFLISQWRMGDDIDPVSWQTHEHNSGRRLFDRMERNMTLHLKR
jgi:hypothetical protein